MGANFPTMLSNTASTKLENDANGADDANNARPDAKTTNTIKCLFCEEEMPDQRTYGLHLHYWHPLYSKL